MVLLTSRTSPLLHLDVVDDPHPRCSVHKEDEDVGVVTEDADCLDSVHRSMQHVTAHCRLDESGSCCALKPAHSTGLSFWWTCDSHAVSRC